MVKFSVNIGVFSAGVSSNVRIGTGIGVDIDVDQLQDRDSTNTVFRMDELRCASTIAQLNNPREGHMNARFMGWVSAMAIGLALLFAGSAMAGQEGAFAGTWTASGTYQPLDFEQGREVFTFRLSGHVNLKSEIGEVADLWSECAGLWDAQTGSATRCVWRDPGGEDAAYCLLEGRLVEEGVRVTGQFVGGTGNVDCRITGRFVFYLAGRSPGQHRYRFCRRLRCAGAGACFRHQARQHPGGCHLDHHVGDCRHCGHAGGWRSRFHGPPGREGAAQQSQVHHLYRTGGDLYHDHVCWNRADRIFHPAGYCRGSQGDRRAPVAAAGHCHGGVPDCHYRIAHIGGGDFFRQ
jgi:hypothetical protein